MILCIAGLYVDVAADDSLVESLPNLLPFVVAGVDKDSVICHIRTGRHIAGEEMSPTFSSRSEDKIVHVWLKPDECKLSLSDLMSGRTYWLQADRQWHTVSTDWIPGSSESFACLNDILMIAFVYRSAFFHTTTVHASAVAVHDQGCAFVGPSGIGKSTHSRLWIQYIPGTRLLNDDQPVLRLHPDGTVMLYGTPWSGKTTCYHNEGVRLKALFFMQQALENHLTRLSGIEAFQQLMKATSLMGRDTITFQAISQTQAYVCGAVQAYRFKNRPDKDAVSLSYQVFIDSLTSDHI